MYYSTANLVPSHYSVLFQRSMFKFVWNLKYEPVARNTLFLDFEEGGLKIPNLKTKFHALYLSHLQKNLFVNQKQNGRISQNTGLVCN